MFGFTDLDDIGEPYSSRRQSAHPGVARGDRLRAESGKQYNSRYAPGRDAAEPEAHPSELERPKARRGRVETTAAPFAPSPTEDLRAHTEACRQPGPSPLVPVSALSLTSAASTTTAASQSETRTGKRVFARLLRTHPPCYGVGIPLPADSFPDEPIVKPKMTIPSNSAQCITAKLSGFFNPAFRMPPPPSTTAAAEETRKAASRTPAAEAATPAAPPPVESGAQRKRAVPASTDASSGWFGKRKVADLHYLNQLSEYQRGQFPAAKRFAYLAWNSKR
eukprot:TRINITY_DN10551_c0_g1_i1.p1 TRINITY_DN10551_c0_g1~~TRINITY_DN10551_c0_g1_i1.p1  ORF type:complete len:278 (+),score=18.37 TRINITY_DN10551_c0_g1_i1:88-921(+)